MSPERLAVDDLARRGRPTISASGSDSPRIRDAPVSPVRVNFQSGNWAQPSNANIEVVHPAEADVIVVDRTQDRRLPPPRNAPVPPTFPHQVRKSSAPTASPSSYHAASPLSRPSDTTINSKENAFDRVSSPAAVALSSRPEGARATVGAPFAEGNRNSRESDTTASTTQQQVSTESSATTSASSVSGPNETPDCQDHESTGSSLIEGHMPTNKSVPLFQYHHQQQFPTRISSSFPLAVDARASSNPDLGEGSGINRHLTPTTGAFARRSSLPRPPSSYSVYSDVGLRGRSPGLMPGGPHMRAPSVQSRKSPDVRPSSYVELLNVPYPQPAPAPINFDNAQLRNAVGSNASLLSTQKTLEMYRQNVKKTSDLSIQYAFAVFLISTAQEQGHDLEATPRKKGESDQDGSSPQALVKEARQILQKLSSAGYPFAQYYLADGFASGLFSKGKEDYGQAFPLFVLAAKHGHAESAYRTALCYEFGWGCRKDPAKAVQFLRIAASKRHPGAMTRLGKACLSGDLGEKRYREGIKWMKLAAEAADTVYNAAPYQLACLYETGYGHDIFKDEAYSAELFTQAAELGHPEANFRMGEAYEHGKLGCPRDPALSVHFYTGAADKGHAGAMMGLCAWYMVGAPPILEKDEEEAYEWARRSAELGYVKAQYAVGYFTETGIGCRRDILEANVWYVKAADAGDERAKQRIAIIQAAISGGTPMEVAPPRDGKTKKDDKDCILM
ncbi:HCP-like protein [Sodiomyces alkalinus F11]|uniref:HCP-like protein n=1 Tax=Sodiomyces alkalinus (strain CBS 110278 / VKM F-3762 / F11) TaxID=1314773 RepID=A0A3N2PZS9_SODAK|nr:HCP-like protein [Sodiomyces alkalinus F11]ROT40029.1 HCP-like protein [Sodiomyces alkalinus F11]